MTARWFWWMAFALPAMAQQGAPHAAYVYPAGGRQGSTFQVMVGGQFLDGVKSAMVSGAGVSAAVVEHLKPLTPGQATDLRDKAKELAEKASPTEEDRKTIAEIRTKLAEFARRPMTPALAETVRVQVTVSAGADLGQRELRLMTPNGLTNPLIFCVGQLPEVSRLPDRAAAARPNAQARAVAPEPTIDVTLPVLVNGQVAQGGVDRYRFAAVKGQRIVIAAKARELLPYISDAVPGWFQATLSLADSQGREVKYADHYQFHPDPVLYYEIPADGAYTVAIHDSIYRGREDFVYRIEMGELPFVTSIFPLGGRVGSRVALEVNGWNLPSGKMTEEAKVAGVRWVSVRGGEMVSNAVPMGVDTLPEALEREPNDKRQNAQRVALPVVVNGRVMQAGDVDGFRFQGKAGEEIVAEVTARRLNSPLDSMLRLTDAAGKEIAINDDAEDKRTALLTHHADSRVQCKLPANGWYYLWVSDAQGKGGADYAYRVRIAGPQPDFELRMTPASVNARAGATVPITVYALRRDGFAGDITVSLKDAPAGFVLSGGVLPGNAEGVRMTLSMPGRAEGPWALELEGRATIAGREEKRVGGPAEDMIQAFYFHHLVPVTDWLAEVTGAPRPNARAPWTVAAETVRLPRGGTASVRVGLNALRLAETLRLELNGAPEGISIEGVEKAEGGVAIVLKADGKVKAGLRGNLIVDAFQENAARRRSPLGTLPAIAFEVM